MKLSFSQSLLRGLTAGTVSFLINKLLAILSTWILKVPVTFAPFTTLPLLSGCFGGALLASIVFFLMQSIPRFSKPLFILIVIAALGASFYLPYRITHSTYPRFFGVTPQVQVVLAMMHAIVAICVTFFLLKRRKAVQNA